MILRILRSLGSLFFGPREIYTKTDMYLRREYSLRPQTIELAGTLYTEGEDGDVTEIGEVQSVTIRFAPGPEARMETDGDEIVAGLRSMGAKVRDVPPLCK